MTKRDVKVILLLKFRNLNNLKITQSKLSLTPTIPLMASAYVVLLLFIFVVESIAAQQIQSTFIRLGSSLSPTGELRSWTSPSGRFAFGFYKQGGGFLVGSWLVTTPDITVVWTANRDDPPLPSNARLTVTMDGKLILNTTHKDKLIANTAQSASSAAMFDSGNFVLYNNSSGIIWSSFDSPTDTIWGGQNLSAGSELIASVSESNSSSGRFRLKLQYDGNLVLYPINTVDDDYTEGYWDTGTDLNRQVKNRLYLNNTGDLVLFNSSMSIIYSLYPDDSSLSNDYNDSFIYRATLGHDGIFRLYSHCFISQGTYNTTILMRVPEDMCDVKTFCGLNSYCTLNDEDANCRCLPGTVPVDSNQTASGCERNFTDEMCNGRNRNTGLYNMTLMEKMTWYDYPYLKEEMSEEDCKNSCLYDCNCDAVLYYDSTCGKHKLPLKSARRDQTSDSNLAYIKTGNISIKSHDDFFDPIAKPPISSTEITSKKPMLLILAITLGFAICSFVFLATSGYFMFKHRVLKYKRLLETGNYFEVNNELTLRSFSYSELKKATNGFKQLLGKGSFGAVYKGSFRKGDKLVAVKRLEKVVHEGEREFQAEMHVIGRTHHKNLVRLLGYCAEDSKRLIVYEYMSNGSLADLLFRSKRSPDWNERVRIALDIAKGILYLHDECEQPIIHCDIKPQNILMDDHWTAKICDFGLAKLLMPDQTRTFTLIRGTRGYLAPEWYKNTPISVKADIYSFGVVLLEIVCCRRNMDIDPSKPEEIVLTNWVYKCFIERELKKLVRGQEVEKKTMENMVKVGLWCVQDEPALRPSMKSVVLMLEGITDISIPPCPTATPW